MMKWRASLGNGQASTEALSKLSWLQKQSVRIQPIGKKGSRPNLLVDDRGVAWSLVVSGANRHDVSQLEIVWDEIVIERPDDIEPQPCADKGYDEDPAGQIIISKG